METKNSNLDNWDDFLGSWLKADIVTVVPAKVVVVKVRADSNPQGDPQVVLTVNYNAKKYDFSLNATNAKFIKEEAKLRPNELLNKTLTLVKSQVMNPQTHKRQDSLFIDKVE